jgi:hypothetical protein
MSYNQLIMKGLYIGNIHHTNKDGYNKDRYNSNKDYIPLGVIYKNLV